MPQMLSFFMSTICWHDDFWLESLILPQHVARSLHVMVDVPEPPVPVAPVPLPPPPEPFPLPPLPSLVLSQSVWQFCWMQGARSLMMHDVHVLSGRQSALQGSDAFFAHEMSAEHCPPLKFEP